MEIQAQPIRKPEQSTQEGPQPLRLIKLSEVKTLTTLSTSEICRRIAAGRFSRQLILGSQSATKEKAKVNILGDTTGAGDSMYILMVVLIGSEPRVDSRQLAKQLGKQHKNCMALIERYSEAFQELGLLEFNAEAIPVGKLGGSNVRFVLLNEDQAFFLLTLSRNNDRAVKLRSELVRAFREARYGHACHAMEARKKEASNSGRRLARWRYDKSGVYAQVAYLREQLRLPLDMEDVLL